MYCVLHGAGEPLLLLHGALSTLDTSFGAVLPSLAETRQVIAVEQQGHRRTADIDRPLSYAQMAEDTAALLRELEIERTDVFGYSMGAGVALELAIRHPGPRAQARPRVARLQPGRNPPRDARSDRSARAPRTSPGRSSRPLTGTWHPTPRTGPSWSQR